MSSVVACCVNRCYSKIMSKVCVIYPQISEINIGDFHSDKVKILDSDPKYLERAMKEAIYIRNHKPTLNRQGTVQPSNGL